MYAVGSPGPMPAFPERVAAVQALLGHLTRGLLDGLPDGVAVLEPVDRPGAPPAPFFHPPPACDHSPQRTVLEQVPPV